MARILKVLGLGLVIAAIVWLVTIWQWQNAERDIGMGDIVLRVCCFLEGIEMTERRLGWSARSGKIVLRLALIRLQRHHLKAAMAARPAP